jgi:mono/diheme cytochrome c family protein
MRPPFHPAWPRRAAWALLAAAACGAATPAAAAQAEPGPGDPARGEALYGEMCAACHGTRGEGSVGPSLKDLHERREVASTVEWIKNPSVRMPKLFPSSMTAQDVNDVASYVSKF